MRYIKPMLCQKGTENDLDRLGWVGEVKLDGTRGLLIKTEKEFMIQNRRGINYTRRLPEITEEAKDIPGTFTVDGEICYFNTEGISVFTPCQRRCSTQDIGKIWFLKSKFPVTFMAFDVLELNNEDLRDQPYATRKAVLKHFLETLRGARHIKYTEHSKSPKQLFEDIISRGGEGIILKRLDSGYTEDYRSYSWLKVKLEQKAVCEVVGWTEGNNRRSKSFGSLVLMQNGEYVGNVGGGFSDHELVEITDYLKSCPSMPKPFLIDEPYTAVKTDMKVLVRYHKRTETGVFRFPVFLKVVPSFFE
jgi:ATP-dependent DNA ligase